MREGWDVVQLGEILERSNERLGDASEPEILTCTEGKGLIRQRDKFSRRVARDDTTAYKIVRPADIVFNPYLLWLGAVGQSEFDFTGITSPVYEVFRPVESKVVPRFAGLLICHESMHPKYDSISTGSIPRRRRATADRFIGVEVALPAKEAQQRIAHVIDAIAQAIRHARRVESRAKIALDAYLDAWVTANLHSASRALGDMALMGSGPSWKAADERVSPADDAMPVIGIKNTPSGDELDLSVIGWVSGLPDKTRRLTESSLLMIRTNGNRSRIGNVYRVSQDAVGKAYSAFQIALFPHDEVDRDAIYWQLRAPCMQRSISAAASGTTGLGNVAVSWLKQLELSWPDLTERAAFVAIADVLLGVRLAAEQEVLHLRRLHDAAVWSLLSGAHEIPESYDGLLAEATSA